MAALLASPAFRKSTKRQYSGLAFAYNRGIGGIGAHGEGSESGDEHGLDALIARASGAGAGMLAGIQEVSELMADSMDRVSQYLRALFSLIDYIDELLGDIDDCDPHSARTGTLDQSNLAWRLSELIGRFIEAHDVEDLLSVGDKAGNSSSNGSI